LLLNVKPMKHGDLDLIVSWFLLHYFSKLLFC